VSKRPVKGVLLSACLGLTAANGPAAAQDRTLHFDGADAPPAATGFQFAGSTWSGGKIETEGAPGLLASGAFHYEVQADGAQATFDPPARDVGFYFVHGFGVAPGVARAFDAADVELGSVASQAATTYAAPGGFRRFETSQPIARITFTGGAVDAVAWKSSPQDVALALGTQVNGAWLNTSPAPYLGGQGLMLEYLPETRRLFVAWFTYDGTEVAQPRQRWLIAEGPTSADGAELQLFSTSGGRFNEASPVQQPVVGTLRLRFTGCDSATAEYALPGEQRSGTFQIRRARSMLTGFDCDG
jgi:hypothetical protein